MPTGKNTIYKSKLKKLPPLIGKLGIKNIYISANENIRKYFLILKEAISLIISFVEICAKPWRCPKVDKMDALKELLRIRLPNK